MLVCHEDYRLTKGRYSLAKIAPQCDDSHGGAFFVLHMPYRSCSRGQKSLLPVAKLEDVQIIGEWDMLVICSVVDDRFGAGVYEWSTGAC